MSKPSKKLLALLIVAVIPSCEGWSTQVPAGTSIQLQHLPRVNNSDKAPCWMQEQVAAQNSYIKQTETKTDVTFKAPCVVETKKVAGAK